MSESGADRTALPESVGRYEIRARLASDPLNSVYEAFDPVIERPVVVKLFPLAAPDSSATAVVREAFTREMRRAGVLTHPGIVALYDAGPCAGGLFMASEFVEGENLGGALARDPDLDLPLRVSLLVQIVDALEHARDLGVAHLNLKPTNIRLGADYMLKVGSFGVGPVVDALVAVVGGRRVFSRYVAPERWHGEAGDFRSDAFSLAQVALDILAGVDRPEPAEGWLTPPPLPAVLAAHGVRADRWATLFALALAEDPADRFPSAAAFNAELLMRLELNETEARLAWETSRTMGALAVPDPTLFGTVIGSMSDPAPRVLPNSQPAPSAATTTTTTTTTTAAATPNLISGESETILAPTDESAAARQGRR